MTYISGVFSDANEGGDRWSVAQLGTVVDLVPIWGPNGPSGLTITLDRDQGADHRALADGRRIYLTAGGAPYWGGVISDVQRGQPWTITVLGWAARAQDFQAVMTDGSNPYANPAAVVEYAIQRGLEWAGVTGNLAIPGTTPAAPTSSIDLDTFLANCVLYGGPIYYVNGEGNCGSYTAPTAPSVAAVCPPDGGHLSLQDYANVLVADFYDVDNGATLNFGKITTSDPLSRKLFGAIEKPVDLTKIGLIHESDAQRLIDNLLPMIAPTFRLADPIELPAEAITSLQGSQIDPRLVPCSVMVALRGAAVPSYIQSDPTAPYAFRLGQLQWTESTQLVQLTGFAAQTTDFSSILAPSSFPPGFVA